MQKIGIEAKVSISELLKWNREKPSEVTEFHIENKIREVMHSLIKVSNKKVWEEV